MTVPPATGAVRHDVESEIHRELTAFFDLHAARAAAYGPHFARLWAVAAECAVGGKLLRPRLLVGAYDALAPSPADDGEVVDRVQVVRIAAAIEILHYAFLLHDDVIDGDVTRRHRPNLVGRVLDEAARAARAAGTSEPAADPLHFARSAAILMGDLLLTAVHHAFARMDVPHATRIRLLDLLDRTIAETVAGELADVGLADGIISPDLHAVLAMDRSKTAAYTFALPLVAAAVLAGHPHLADTLTEVGGRMGLAFQLQDDLLSTFADTAEHGKDRFSDLREGKETALIAFARMTSAWPQISGTFGAADFTDADGLAARAALAACGAEDFVRSLIDEQLRECDTLLTGSGGAPAPLVSYLTALSASLEGRRR